VRKHVHFTFAPTARGVGVSFRVRRGDVVEVADFRAAGASLGPVDLRLWPPRRRHSLAVSSTPLVSGGFASATLGRVVRVGARMRATRRGTLTWMPR
jgi:hypothetical protein